MKRSHFYNLGIAMARFRWPVLAVWLVLIIGGGILATRFHDTLEAPTFATSGSESQQVQTLLDEEFNQSFTEQDLLVFYSDSLTIDDPAYQGAVQSAVDEISSAEGVAMVVSPLNPAAEIQVSDDGRAAFAVVGITGEADERSERADLYSEIAAGATTGDVRVMFTGQSPISKEIISIAQEDLASAETVGLPIAMLILLVAFGSLIAAGLPLLTAVSGIAITFGALTIVGQFVGFNFLIENVITMIGLAVGIDYVLFSVTRFREELAVRDDVYDAVGHTMATAGKTVLFSGLTVLVSVSGLLIVSSPTFQQIGIGMMAVVPVMVLAALTLLPAVLALLGTWVNRLTPPFLRSAVNHPDPERGIWARWSHLVMRRPALWAVGTTLLLALLAIPLFNLSLGVTLGTDAAEGTDAGDGYAILNEQFSPGELAPIRIVYESQDGPLDDADMQAIARLSSELAADEQVTAVDSLTTALDQAAGDHSRAAFDAALEDPALAGSLSFLTNVDAGGNLALITAVPAVAPDTAEANDLVERIREEIAPEATDGAGSEVYVGGFSAEIVDISDEIDQKSPLVIGFVLGLSFVLLLLIFRSVLIPLKAIVMNLLSVGAAYGLLVLVFQEGYGQSVFGFESTGLIQVDLPLFTFAILFGLSMDYEVFLLSRIKEEWEQTGRTNEAIAHGLQHTARTITSAAAIMVVVFMTFAFTSLLEVQQIGFALGAAILIDATLIRILLVPASMRLLGDWNWWLPSWLDRILPRISLSEGTPGHEPALVAGPVGSVPSPQRSEAKLWGRAREGEIRKPPDSPYVVRRYALKDWVAKVMPSRTKPRRRAV